jgi:hypothetical protein
MIILNRIVKPRQIADGRRMTGADGVKRLDAGISGLKLSALILQMI